MSSLLYFRNKIFWAFCLVMCLSLTACDDYTFEDPRDSWDPDESPLANTLMDGVWSAGDTNFAWDPFGFPVYDRDTDIDRLYFFKEGRGVHLTVSYHKDHSFDHYSKYHTMEWFTYQELSRTSVRLNFQNSGSVTLNMENKRLHEPRGYYNDFYFYSFTSADYNFMRQFYPIKGSCGTDAEFSYEPWDNALYIYGDGEMDDFDSEEDQPWYLAKRNIYTLDFSEDVSYVGSYAFYNMPELQRVELNNAVSGIGDCAFGGPISKIRLGSGIRSLGKTPFLTSESSGHIYVNSLTPPEAGEAIVCSDKTRSSIHSSWTLHVPEDAVEAYEAATGWSSFKIKGEPSLTGR